MSREILLAKNIIKFEKGFLPTPTSFGSYEVIGYHCKPTSASDVWDEWKAEESMVAALAVTSDKLSTATATKSYWATLSDERKAVILAVTYLSLTTIKPSELKDIIISLNTDPKVQVKELWDFLQPQQPRKLIERLRKSLRCGEVCALYPLH